MGFCNKEVCMPFRCKKADCFIGNAIKKSVSLSQCKDSCRYLAQRFNEAICKVPNCSMTQIIVEFRKKQKCGR